jgi:hypothetical protein
MRGRLQEGFAIGFDAAGLDTRQSYDGAVAEQHRLDLSDPVRISDEGGVLLELGPATAKSGASLRLTVGQPGGKIEATFPETQWLIATTSFGFMLGHLRGASGSVLGGLAGYAWGKWSWSRANR